MAFKPTPEQDYVLNIKNQNTIVSASAGSGKTTVMVEKIFNIIKDQKIPVNDILVVTFTKSAALEMKQRLAKKLSDNSEDQFIQNQIDDLSTADICTVDSFCEKIVKKYFYILGIDESFSVISSQEKNDLMSRAMQSAMAIFKNNNVEDYKILLETFSNNRTEKQIIALILKVSEFMSSLKDENAFLEKTKSLYLPNGIAEKFLNNYIEETLKEYKQSFINLQKQCEDFGFSKYIQSINDYLSYLDSVILPNTLEAKLNAINVNPSVTIRAERSDENNFKEKIAKAKTSCQKFISTIKEKLGNSTVITDSYNTCQKISSAFIDLLLLFKQKYNMLKLKYNMLDFSDLEKYTLQILKNSEILAEVKNNYQKIFVDEFQDVNEIQFTIFDTIKSLDNTFYVGDFKQAIYGFRQSNPKLFLDTVNKFKTDDNSCSATLKSNFRSDNLVLDFINIIFNSIMTLKTSDIDYHEANLDGDKTYKQSEIPAIQINVIQEDKNTDEIKKGVYSVKNDFLSGELKDNIKHKEAQRIAEIITEIIGKQIYDNKAKTYKSIEYSDIAILLRKRGDFQSILVNTLTRCNIPCVANLKELLDETYDVKIFYSALKATVIPNDDYITCGLMLSPLFNFNENELATIKLNAEGKTFCETVINYKMQNDNALSKKIESYISSIDSLKCDIRYKGIYEALWNLCDNTNYFFNISSDDNFTTRQQNVTNYIDSFAGTNFEFDLIKYINMRENALSDTNTTNVSSQTSRVTITTMHQSKGLEYPVVILANLGEDFSREPDNAEIKINSDLGVGIKTYDKETKTKYAGLFYTAINLKNKSENLGERLRLLYVATTRAKNALYMIGSSKELNFVKNTDFSVLNNNCYLNLIIGSLSQDDIDKVNLGKSFNISGNEKYEFKYISSFSNSTTSSYQFLSNEALSDEETQLKQSAIKYLSTALDSPKHKLALKNSVSKLSFDEENSSVNFAPKNLSLAEDLTDVYTTEQGTTVHKILEVVDFFKIDTISELINEINQKFNSSNFDLNSIDVQTLFNIILKIKTFINKEDKILKEQKFVSYIPASQILDETFDDKILVQGAIDLMVVKFDKICLFDYKLSSLKKDSLINKYKKQLSLYGLAIQKAFNKPVDKYIVSLKYGEIYKVK